MFPSSPQTFLTRSTPIRLSLGRNSQTLVQKSRTTPQTSGISSNSFGGTIPILSLPSVTQGIKRLPVFTPDSNKTVFFTGKRS